MKDLNLIEVFYLNAYRSILREKGYNPYTAKIFMISEKGIGIFYAANLQLKSNDNINFNVLALERYLLDCNEYEAKTDFMKTELKNGKVYATNLKNKILSELS
ncbi:hypothetical protein E1N66_19600 [Pantoea allii]|nr:hypothetical protein [Pantoea allii]THB82700.1 hypothetical protein E1N66_19600 [Pantoea allii]